MVGTVALFAFGALALGVVFYRTRDRYFVGVIPGLLPDHRSEAPQQRRLFAQLQAAAVRFDPPDEVRPALCGVILRKKADKHAVSAAVTDLAVRGHLTITQLPKGFRIARTGEGDGEISSYESGIVAALSSPVTLRRRRRKRGSSSGARSANCPAGWWTMPSIAGGSPGIRGATSSASTAALCCSCRCSR